MTEEEVADDAIVLKRFFSEILVLPDLAEEKMATFYICSGCTVCSVAILCLGKSYKIRLSMMNQGKKSSSWHDNFGCFFFFKFLVR